MASLTFPPNTSRRRLTLAELEEYNKRLQQQLSDPKEAQFAIALPQIAATKAKLSPAEIARNLREQGFTSPVDAGASPLAALGDDPIMPEDPGAPLIPSPVPGTSGQPGQGPQTPGRVYDYQQMPDAPNLPQAPGRNRKGEARQAATSALIQSIALALTGNGRQVPRAISGAIRGSLSSSDVLAQDDQQQYANDSRRALQGFQFKRQGVTDHNTQVARQQALDQAADRAKQAELEKLRGGWPAFVKNLRESNPEATGEQLGHMAQAYLDQADRLAGGPGQSGILLRQRTVNPSDAESVIQNPDGTTSVSTTQEPAGRYPIVDLIEPDKIVKARAASAFMDSLEGLSPSAVQSRLKSAEDSGILDTLGLLIPKKDGAYQLDVTKAQSLPPLPDTAENERKRIQADLRFSEAMLKDPHLTPAGRDYWSRQRFQQQKALGGGSDAPIPGNAYSQMTPAEKQAAADRAAGRAVTVRGQNISKATADANRAARGTGSGREAGSNERSLGIAYNKLASLQGQLAAAKAEGDTPNGRMKVAALQASLTSVQRQIRALGGSDVKAPPPSSTYNGATRNVTPGVVNYGSSVDEFALPGGARFGMKALSDFGFSAEVRDAKPDGRGGVTVQFEAKNGGRYKPGEEKQAIAAMQAAGAQSVHWAGNGYRAFFPGEKDQAKAENRKRQGKTPGGRRMTIEEGD